jgi:PAT family beta-lactamase induction signal transducer AmpG
MNESGVDLGTIGLFALVGLPYTLKFLWAPVLDRFTLFTALGRRRGWMVSVQVVLAAAVAALGQVNPRASALGVAVAALVVTFLSASQDIVIDAYRRESLADEEQGLGASVFVYGYRAGMLVASGGGLILADVVPFSWVYLGMAVATLAGVIPTLLAQEPPVAAGTPRSLREAVLEPFWDYFSRRDAWLILLFIVLYKIGDVMAAHMTTPFYQALGFTKTEIGAVVKLFGFSGMALGGFLGGILILRWGIFNSLWRFGVLQMLSILGFVVLGWTGPRVSVLAVVIVLENVAFGMGTSAYVAFMASLTNKKFTATQYALLSSLMGIPRVVLSAPTGYLAQWLGWQAFFLLCAAMALPGLVLLARFRSWMQPTQQEAPRRPASS